MTPAITNASADAPPMPLMTAGTMMNTLDAGVTADSVIRMFSLNVSPRESCCAYFSVSGTVPGTFVPPA